MLEDQTVVRPKTWSSLSLRIFYVMIQFALQRIMVNLSNAEKGVIRFADVCVKCNYKR